MAHRDTRATTPGQALTDLTTATRLITDYEHQYPGRLIICRIILDLPETPPDYDDPHPV